jgi:hypothetical protein
MLEVDEVVRGRLTRSQTLIVSESMPSTRLIPAIRSLGVGGWVLTARSDSIKVRLDLQADKSPIVVKGPFFPRVVNPRYQICGTNV